MAHHYAVTVDAKRTKETMKCNLQANLQEEEVLMATDVNSDVTTSVPGLTFEQQR